MTGAIRGGGGGYGLWLRVTCDVTCDRVMTYDMMDGASGFKSEIRRRCVSEPGDAKVIRRRSNICRIIHCL